VLAPAPAERPWPRQASVGRVPLTGGVSENSKNTAWGRWSVPFGLLSATLVGNCACFFTRAPPAGGHARPDVRVPGAPSRDASACRGIAGRRLFLSEAAYFHSCFPRMFCSASFLYLRRAPHRAAGVLWCPSARRGAVDKGMPGPLTPWRFLLAPPPPPPPPPLSTAARALSRAHQDATVAAAPRPWLAGRWAPRARAIL